MRYLIAPLFFSSLLWILFSPPFLPASRAHLAMLATKKEQRIEAIDREIEMLEDKKRGYEAKALRAEDQAIRLQFQDQFQLETRAYWKIAEENRAKAAIMQERILELQEEKRQMNLSAK